MYKALTIFTDLQDNNYKYQAGDIFPRKGMAVSKARLEELSTNKNRRHIPVIEEIIEESKEENNEVKPAPKKSSRKKTNA